MCWARPLIGQILLRFDLIDQERHLASISLKIGLGNIEFKYFLNHRVGAQTVGQVAFLMWNFRSKRSRFKLARPPGFDVDGPSGP